MAITRPFAFNTGSTITGTIQVGNLAIGVDAYDYSEQPGGVRWWNGPDESLGYVIAHETLTGNQPNPVGVQAFLGFWRSEVKTEESFISLAEWVAAKDNDPQTFLTGDDAKTWLNDNGYWTSYTPSTPFNDLEIIASYLRNYMDDYKNPNFYDYWLDGDGYYISDGGGDMYDGGNISTPWLISGDEYIGTGDYDSGSYPYAVDYTQSATTQMMDTSFGYISLGYEQYNNGFQSPTYLPLTVIGARDNETYGPGLPIGFQTGGNSGADGGGALSSGSIYSGETVSGFTVYAFYRETYNAGDPSHCDLYILLGHPNWNSSFGPTIGSYAQPTSEGGCGGYLYTTGNGTQNILAIKTLLSKSGGQLVTSGECQTVVNNFIARVSEAVGFGPSPSPTPTPTPTSTTTPTPTASLAVTPTPSPQPVTGYSFNLIDLPYNFPTSGNTIMNASSGQTGTTEVNLLSTSSRGIYWNSIDSDGVDRSSYFSQFTGQSITITLSQTGSTAIYSGDTDSLKYWSANTGTPPGVPGTGFVFGTGIGLPPTNTPSGTAVLIQSATTEWDYGIPVYISVTINTPGATPTPTPTPTTSLSVTPTMTPTPTASEVISPTPTPTPTPTITPTSGFTITITESGSNVVMSASGTLNTTDLTLVSSGVGPVGGGGLGINNATFILGGVGGTYDQYSGFTTIPSNFGTGSGLPSSSSSGDIMGVIIDNTPPYMLAVPNGYVSGTLISGSQTFNNQTLSGMGLTNGTYTYTWGSGANEDSIQVVIGGSSPSPTPTPTATYGTVGDGWLFYGSEGPLTVGPPIADGNVVFTDNSGSPILETFNPNKSSGTDYLYFNVRDTSGFDYTTQFSNLQTNGGTINITQNGDTATYVLGPNMAIVSTTGGGTFLQINASMGTQTVSSTSPFVSGTPITITII
jgi:hypothetical protein